MVQTENIKFKLARCFFYNAAKYARDHYYAVTRILIHQKIRLQIFPAPMFIVEHYIKGILVYDVASSVAEPMVVELTAHAPANFVELFVRNTYYLVNNHIF